MSITKEKTIDKIEVEVDGVLQIREVISIMEDGKELSKTYHRFSFAPGSDISGMPANVQAIAAAAWTEEVVAAYQSGIDAMKSTISQ